VRAETRHQLKQDRFSRTTIDVAEATVHWSVEHKNKLIAGIFAAVAIVALLIGGWYYLTQQDLKASSELSQAVRTMGTQLRPANMPPQPNFPSFASAKERATAAQTQLQKVINDYPHTKSADFARYFLGVSAIDLGDNAAAEKDFKEVASVHNDDLSALANFALASVYRNTGRTKDAIDIYKKLADKPTRTVGKTTAQLELASTYQAAQQPAEAKRIYEQVQKENPNTEAAQMALTKAQEIK
jgi:tetratricopeptide (TPR) repeat protein